MSTLTELHTPATPIEETALYHAAMAVANFFFGTQRRTVITYTVMFALVALGGLINGSDFSYCRV